MSEQVTEEEAEPLEWRAALGKDLLNIRVPFPCKDTLLFSAWGGHQLWVLGTENLLVEYFGLKVPGVRGLHAVRAFCPAWWHLQYVIPEGA